MDFFQDTLGDIFGNIFHNRTADFLLDFLAFDFKFEINMFLRFYRRLLGFSVFNCGFPRNTFSFVFFPIFEMDLPGVIQKKDFLRLLSVLLGFSGFKCVFPRNTISSHNGGYFGNVYSISISYFNDFFPIFDMDLSGVI